MPTLHPFFIYLRVVVSLFSLFLKFSNLHFPPFSYSLKILVPIHDGLVCSVLKFYG
jgi:hypothetical protein